MRRAWALLALLLAPPRGLQAAREQRPVRPPLLFEPAGNGFVARASGGAIRIEPRSYGVSSGRDRLAVRLGTPAPARPCVPQGEPAARLNDLRGPEEAWRVAVPLFRRVSCPEVFAGVDAEYYAAGAALELDFRVRPGGDPAAVELAFSPGVGLSLERDGTLVARAGTLLVKHAPPRLFEELSGGLRREVQGGYLLRGGGRVGFRTGARSGGRTLVIDPVIEVATLVGGSGEDNALALSIDASGAIYTAGFTTSPDYRGAASAASGEDAFVTKLSAAGEVAFTTLIGGRGQDRAAALALDASGNLYLAGLTTSPDFPVRGPFQASLRGVANAFVAKLSADGARILYATYLGGAAIDAAAAIAADASGRVVVAGSTTSRDFPTAFLAPSPPAGGADAFVTALTPDGRTLLFSRLLGGSAHDAASAVALDGGRIFVAGITASIDFPASVAEGLFVYGGGDYDGFVAELDSLGRASPTLFGGKGRDLVHRLVPDGSGGVFLAGETTSANLPFPAQAAPWQASLRGPSDGFVARLKREAAQLPIRWRVLGGSYLGGSGNDSVTALALDGAGLTLAGYTDSADFPLAEPLAARLAGGSDAFVSRLDVSASRLLESTFLGGAENDAALAAAPGPAGELVVLGSTGSSGFPRLGPGAQPFAGGGIDSFLVRLAPGAAQLVPIVLSSSGVGGTFFTTELTLTNRGALESEVALVYTAAFGGGSGVARDRIPAGRQKVIPDAVAYLRSLGLPLPEEGNRGGTLAVRFLSCEGTATARTTTAVEGGRAGLAYAGVPQLSRLTGTAYVAGLRQDAADRSNLALLNAGTAGEGDVVLRVTVSPEAGRGSITLADVTLPPGGFQQIGEVLRALPQGGESGYARIERLSGSAPYFAYGVVNDQRTGDGSFVPPVAADLSADGWTLPVVVENGAFLSEVVFTNFGDDAKRLSLTLVAGGVAPTTLELPAGQQLVVPNFVTWLRERGAAGLPAGPVVGAVFVRLLIGRPTGLAIGARTTTAGGAGRFGLFYPAVPQGAEPTTQAWLFGLKQDGENRTNLALVNGGEDDALFAIDLYDGQSGRLAATLDALRLPARGWSQIGSVLERAPGVAQGYAQVRRIAGSGPFLAYAVINDGGKPGERTGDGAYLPGVP